MGETYTITEYGSFSRGKSIAGYKSLPVDTFDALENFVLTNNSAETDALELMGVSARKGVGKIITAKNYVGVITMNDGISIEILPKIYSEDIITETKVKKLLVDMLKTLRFSPFKNIQTTNVDVDKLSIFEVFIRMFADEVFNIVKRGLKCNYEALQSNGTVCKGKILFSEQIKYNHSHKERCYIECDEFNANCAENRIIKSTLNYLYKCTSSYRNKKDIKTLLEVFANIDESADYKADFDRIVPERRTTDYQTALLWSKVFLTGKSFTSFSGSQVAFALLFPMETLFESYIAAQLKKELRGTELLLSVQDKTYHLFDSPKKFLIKPDIVVRNKAIKRTFVLDTKWKLLSNNKANYGIAQSDMYQMYAYQKKYSAKNVTLIYPLTAEVDKEKDISFSSYDGTIIKIRFLDLLNIGNSIAMIKTDLINID